MWGLLNSWITENAIVEPLSPKDSSSNAPTKTLTDTKKEKEKEKVPSEGVVKFDDKLVLIINQRENIDANGKMRNMSNQDVLDILKFLAL